MAENSPDRCLLIRSRIADGYRLSEMGLKDLQHVLTDWFPRAIHADLTDDTARVDVVVRKDFTSGKSAFNVSFIRADDSVIKSGEYAEDRLLGKRCDYYNQRKARYDGNKDGFDHRLAFYTAAPTAAVGRSK